MDLSKFIAIEFEWDHGNLPEIEAHKVETWECEECFFNNHEVYRNKRKRRQYDTYRLMGVTDAGRKLNVISSYTDGNVVARAKQPLLYES